MKHRFPTLLLGILIGATLFGSGTALAASGIMAELSSQPIYVDGHLVQMTAYSINGNNYVKLRDIGKEVGFNVSWDNANHCVQVNSNQPYEEEGGAVQATPATNSDGSINPPTGETRYTPKAGDVIRCDDGANYTITDVSRYDKNMFASGPVGELPTATCDWNQMPQAKQPAAEARHFTAGGKEYLFVRNLFETKRMLYTLYNAIGDNPETWKDGALVLHPSGNPKVTIKLSFPDGVDGYSFWPWRASELTDLFNSCPAGTFTMESWDVFCDGIFQYTEYKVKLN